MLTRADLHQYQLDAIEFLKTDTDRSLVAIMGSGKTAVALHAIVDLKATTALTSPVLVVAPLLIAETVWKQEAALWQDTAGLQVALALGTPKQRIAAINSRADVIVINYDNAVWLLQGLQPGVRFGAVIADESSRIKNPTAKRTRVLHELGRLADRRWTLTGTPRGHQLTDVWGPAQFVTRGTCFPPFFQWRSHYFFTNDIYERHWFPRHGVERMVTDQLRAFTHVVDQSALATRPPVIEIVRDIPLDLKSAAIYAALDEGGTSDAIAAAVARGLMPKHEMAIVGKLQQVCSGAGYDDGGRWSRLHDRRLDMLAEIHEGHDRPTLVFVNFIHETERIREKFRDAYELRPGNIEAWNRGEIAMLVAHPTSAGHGVNLQHGSDTIVWFSLPWSAELYAQANARLARQGQRNTVNIHVLLSRGKIDEIAYQVVHQRLHDQDRLIAALQQ
jgi:SNF2 family DNA or RNA helicase